MTRKEAIQHLRESHEEELQKLPPSMRIVKLANLLARYRIEHPDESLEWSAQYV